MCSNSKNIVEKGRERPMKKLFNHVKKLWFALTTAVFILINTTTAFATNNTNGVAVDITAGLGQVDNATLAEKIIGIATGIGAIAGAIAVAALVYVGFRMATAVDERARAEAKEHMMQILIGLGVIGLAVMIVGFIAYLIK
jgi:amino acid transporter